MSFFIILIFLISPLTVSASAKAALGLCIDSVIPSLFPFMVAAKCAVLSRDIKEDNLLFKFIAKLFNVPLCGGLSFIFGLICGYPVGAKTAFDLYREKRITKKEAVKLASFANNAGPAFVISVIGGGFLKSVPFGIIIYISLIAGSIITGILIRNTTPPAINSNFERKERISLYDVIPDAVFDSATGIINVTAMIMFFAAFYSVIYKILPAPITDTPVKEGILSGIFEITSGIKILSETSLPVTTLLPLITFLTGFSGISVIFQTKAFARGLNIKTTPCVLCRVLSSLFSSVICYFLTIAILFFAMES